MAKENPISSQVIIVGLLIVIIALIGFLLSKPVAFNPIIDVKPSENMLRDTISVTGRSELTFSPDKAIVYVSVVTDKMDAKEAQTENRDISNRVIDSIKSWGIAESDIETSSYTLNKVQEWNPDTRTYEDKGYRLTHTLKVTTNRITDIGDLVDKAVEAGANEVGQITFTLQDSTELQARNDALKKAMEMAEEKAQILATTAGISLGKVTNIQEQNYYYTPFDYTVARADTSLEAGSAPTQISPQKVEIQSSVTVIFTIS
jgi:uncharacterized protein YggE